MIGRKSLIPDIASSRSTHFTTFSGRATRTFRRMTISFGRFQTRAMRSHRSIQFVRTSDVFTNRNLAEKPIFHLSTTSFAENTITPTHLLRSRSLGSCCRIGAVLIRKTKPKSDRAAPLQLSAPLRSSDLRWRNIRR